MYIKADDDSFIIFLVLSEVIMVDNDSFHFSCVIRGYHIYKSVWSLVVGEVLELRPKDENEHDRYAVGMQKDDKLKNVCVFIFINNTYKRTMAIYIVFGTIN